MGLQIAGTLALLSNSRGDELEADEWGFKYMQASPYYQEQCLIFLKNCREEKSNKMSKQWKAYYRLIQFQKSG